MSTSNYEGPSDGDYVRYVDGLLRTSPLYRSAAEVLIRETRNDFTALPQAPGAEARSAVGRVRQRVQAVAEQEASAAAAVRAPASTAATAPSASPGSKVVRKRRSTLMEQEFERAAREEAMKLRAAAPPAKGWPSWLRITPGRIMFLIVLAIAASIQPGMALIILLWTVVGAIRNALRGNKASS